jgi:hypothetical protein
VRRYLWEADSAVTTARGAAGRGDLAYVSGCLFRAVARLVQVLFARPEPAPLEAALEAMAALTATVRERCAG